MFQKAFKTLQDSLNTGISGISSMVSNLTSQKESSKSSSKIRIKDKEYFEDHLIAEGGYGYIYQITSIQTKQKFALKIINYSSKSHLSQIKNEIALWSKVSKDKNIVRLYDYEITDKTVYIIMELCEQGTLLQYIKQFKEPISETEALSILYQIISGIYKLHSQQPPIAHRDIKIENILKRDSTFKLCDFGSASTDVLDPSNANDDYKDNQFALYEKVCTFNYRPPEMVDKYTEYVVNEKVDIWQLGCLFYAMIFKAHPFQDAEKLTIISAEYRINSVVARYYSEKMIDLIRWMLTPNPQLRPSCEELMNVLVGWDDVKEIELCEEVMALKRKQMNGKGMDNKNKGVGMLSEEEMKKMQKKIKEKEKNKKSKHKEGNQNNGDLLDFGFGDEQSGFNNNQHNNNNQYNNSNTNKQEQQTDLLDFGFINNSSSNNSNQQNNIQQQSQQHSNNDLLDFGFEQSNSNTNNSKNNQNSQNNNGGWMFEFMGGAQNTMNNNNNQQQQKAQTSNDFFFFEQQPQNNNNNNHQVKEVKSNNNTNSNNFFDNFVGFQVDNNKLNTGVQSSYKQEQKSSSNNQDILSFFQ